MDFAPPKNTLKLDERSNPVYQPVESHRPHSNVLLWIQYFRDHCYPDWFGGDVVERPFGAFGGKFGRRNIPLWCRFSPQSSAPAPQSAAPAPASTPAPAPAPASAPVPSSTPVLPVPVSTSTYLHARPGSCSSLRTTRPLRQLLRQHRKPPMNKASCNPVI